MSETCEEYPKDALAKVRIGQLKVQVISIEQTLAEIDSDVGHMVNLLKTRRQRKEENLFSLAQVKKEIKELEQYLSPTQTD